MQINPDYWDSSVCFYNVKYDLQSPNLLKNSGGECMVKMTNEAAARIQSSSDKTEKNADFKARAQRAATKDTKAK